MPKQPSFSLSRLAIYATLILACAVYLVPLVVMLLTSFKTPDDIRTGNLLSIPDVFTLIGWVKAWDSVGGFFWNSVKITVPAVIISTLLGALNGYVLSMWRFRGSQLFFGLLLFGCFLPFQVVLLPASFTLGQFGGHGEASGVSVAPAGTRGRQPGEQTARIAFAVRNAPLSIQLEQLVFVAADGLGVLPDVAGAKQAPRQQLEGAALDGFQVADADLGGLSDLVEGNALTVAQGGEVERQRRVNRHLLALPAEPRPPTTAGL